MTRSLVAVEYGHVTLLPDGGFDDAAEIEISAEYARDLAEALVSDGHEVTLQILVDDKRLTGTDPLRENLAALIQVCNALLPPDLFVLESRLARGWEFFCNQTLAPAARSRVCRALERYITFHRALACSHDIALWHTLRAGALPLDALSSEADAVPSHQGVLRAADLLVSILPARNQDFEALADRDLLGWSLYLDPDRHLARYYFSDDRSPASVSQESWVEFRHDVLATTSETRLIAHD